MNKGMKLGTGAMVVGVAGLSAAFVMMNAQAQPERDQTSPIEAGQHPMPDRDIHPNVPVMIDDANYLYILHGDRLVKIRKADLETTHETLVMAPDAAERPTERNRVDEERTIERNRIDVERRIERDVERDEVERSPQTVPQRGTR
jgi:hypothetical protein